MNSPQRDLPAQGRNWTRRLVNVLVALVVIAVAGATFVFSYAGVHAIALLGGVSPQLARYYPGLFDAVLVIACLAALMLRDGRWWARAWAWLVLVVLLAAIGATDVLHAANYTLRHRTTEGIVAAAPVVAVLLAFSLLLTMLRQSKAPSPAAPAATPLDVPALPAAMPAPMALPAAPAVPVEAPTVQVEAPTVPVAAPTVQVEPPTVPVQAPTAPAAPTEPQDAFPAGEPTVPVPVTAATLTTPPPLAPGPAADPVPEGEPTQPVPLITEAPEARQQTPPDPLPTEEAEPAVDPVPEAYPPAQPNEAVSAATPADEAGEAEDEPAPPTVEIPAVTPRPPGIRYAGNSARDTPKPVDYWDTEDSAQFAGVVYRAQDDEDEDDAPHAPAARPIRPELDDDAPPFATAPFAPAPRLNRVRSMPARPSDEDEDE